MYLAGHTQLFRKERDWVGECLVNSTFFSMGSFLAGQISLLSMLLKENLLVETFPGTVLLKASVIVIYLANNTYYEDNKQ